MERTVRTMVDDAGFDIYLNDVYVGEGSLTVSPPTAQIVNINIHVRREGIGTKVIRSVEDYLMERGVKWVNLDAAEEAAGFWEKMGYSFSDVKTPCVVGGHLRRMTKSLCPQTA